MQLQTVIADSHSQKNVSTSSGFISSFFFNVHEELRQYQNKTKIFPLDFFTPRLELREKAQIFFFFFPSDFGRFISVFGITRSWFFIWLYITCFAINAKSRT